MGKSTFKQIGLFYLPLAASGLLMTIQQPIITSGIARMPEAETSLAAYGVALNLVVFLESPVQMLLSAANALAHDRESFRLLRRFSISLGLALSGLLLLLAWPPVGTLVLSRFMGTPAIVISPGLTMLLVMLPWPFVVGWRRFYQGFFISRGRTRAVSLATFARLCVIFTIVLLTTKRTTIPGVLVGGLALMGGAITEMGIIYILAIRMLKHNPQRGIMTTPIARDLPTLLHFYCPLAVTSLLSVATWPLVTSGIGHAAKPSLSLTAWPLAMSIMWLFTTPIQMLQETALTLAQRTADTRPVTRFGLAVGLIGSLTLGVFAFTPLLQTFLYEFIAAPDAAVPLTVSAVRILIPLPLIATGQSLLRGLLVAGEATTEIRWGMVSNVIVTTLILFVGVLDGSIYGIILAPIATLSGSLYETIVLWRKYNK